MNNIISILKYTIINENGDLTLKKNKNKYVSKWQITRAKIFFTTFYGLKNIRRIIRNTL